MRAKRVMADLAQPMVAAMDENKKITSPLKAIKAFCIECNCGQASEVPRCPCTDCPLYEFRRGKNPYRKQASEEQREKSRARMKEYWKTRGVK